MSSAQDLGRLQAADSRIAALTADVAATESLMRRDPELERVREAAGSAEQERRRRDEEAAAGEAAMNALQARITKLDKRLYGGSVHNPQELVEIQRDLESLRSKMSVAEDAALAQLDDAEAAAASERAGIEALREAEDRRASQIAPLEQRLARLNAELTEATAERERTAEQVDARALELYRRVAQRRTPAVVGIAGDTCGGCHLPLSNQERGVVRAGTAIAQCSNCDRILVP